ncbi:hypothetical protein C1646_747874 [Rhizophagus diaphanus]|nr:hypothetical protein C1646_747874 [Rhizophagus diaphanus] [Rhizophagus sp. MUCL 43196]
MALPLGQTQNGEEAMPVVMVPTVDVPDSVIDQLNNEVGRAPSDLDDNEEMVDFLDEDPICMMLDKNIIVEQELKQQLSSPAHTYTSDQTSEEQDPSSDTAQNIVCMFKKANKLGQEAILY